MSVKERVFERWVESGTDETFDEWRAERKARAMRYREQAALHKQFTAQLGQMSPEMTSTWQMQQAAAMQGIRSMRGPGGIFGGHLP